MPSNLVLVNSDGKELDFLNLGYIPFGKQYEVKVGIKNQSQDVINNIKFCPWPGIKNNGLAINKAGNPVDGAFIIKRSSEGENQVTGIAKEDEGAACPLNTGRGKIFLFTGSAYEDYSEADSIPFPANSSQKLYIGLDWFCKNLLLEFSTPGEYTGLAYKYSSSLSAFSALPEDMVDGTDGTSQNGVLNFGALTELLFKKQSVNSFSMLWIEISCSTVITPAIASEIRQEYVYDLPQSCFLDDIHLYRKLDTTYTEITEGFAKKYLNLGRVVFDANPLLEGESLVMSGYSKIPAPKVYPLTFPSETSVSVDGGEAVTIIPDGETECRDAIPGMVLVFNPGIATENQAEINISPSVNYLSFALEVDGAPGDYWNGDINIGSINAGATQWFYIKGTPPVTESQTHNLFVFENFAYGD